MTTMLHVTGTLRSPADAVLCPKVQELLRRGERRVLLDLSGVSDIDAAGVGELIRAFDVAFGAGGALEIAAVSPRVHRVLETTGVLSLLTAGAESPRV
jgi:anti-anti-sigma factor